MEVPERRPHLRLVTVNAPQALADAELARALRSGRPGAAAAVLNRFGPTVYRFLKRCLGAEQPLDTLVEAVFVRVVRRIQALRDPYALHGFILSAAVQVVRRVLRRRRLSGLIRLPLGPPEPARATGTTPATQPVAASLASFHRILDELDMSDRVAFVLHHVEGLPIAEVASALGTSPAAAGRAVERSWRYVVARVGSTMMTVDAFREALFDEP